MRLTRFAVAAPTAIVLSLLLASAVLASGPGGGSGNGSGNNGRSVHTLHCSNGQTYQVAVENPSGSNGAGQIVGAPGHGILVSGTVTATDTTAGIVIFAITLGDGQGHANQATTACTEVVTETVADLGPPPGGVYPPGVHATDTLVIRVAVVIVLKV
jgi:hypothetical protein